jgi:hypothetical protein
MKSNCSIQCAESNIASTVRMSDSMQAKDSEQELLRQEEDDMHRGYQYLFSFFVLSAALAAPSAMNAAGKPQDNGRQEENRRENRVYDRDHRDYHNWDDREDRSYRVYLGERHREYHPFVELRVKEQRAYWNWRHRHPDHDHDGR